MIRRNVASQPILLGPLTLKSNGDNVTSGASITVRKDGSPVTAAGTLNHVSDGVWEYVPTQGETDCAMLGLILSASNAYAVALTVPTTRLPLQTSGVLPDAAADSAGGLPVLDSNNTIAANVTRFGGTAGIFSGGRPEVNTTHWGGTATTSANVRANVVQIDGQTANASAAVTFPANIGTSTLDAAGVWGHTTRTLTSGAAPSVADIWSHSSRTLTGNVDANIVQIAGQTANASSAVTFPASIGTSTLDASGVWSHSSRTLTSGTAPSVADIWSHTTRTLTDTVDANVVQIAGQTANANGAVTFPANVGTSTLDAAGVWGHASRTLTGSVDANVIQIAGQTANASSAVTFPATIGTSTLDASGVWGHSTRTLTSGAAPSVSDIWSHSSRTLTGNVNANVVQIAGQTANASNAVTFPANIGTSTLDAPGVWNHTSRTLTSGAAPSVADIWSHSSRTLTSGAAPSVADIWSHTSRTLTSTVNANVIQIAGQAANASAAVTFPASIGTSTLDAAEVWSHTTRTITGGTLTNSPPTVAQIVAGVWDATAASYTSSGSTGEKLHQLDTHTTTIKAKTDQLTFTLGRVDANATAVIQGADVTLIVNGTTQGVIAGLGSARITIRSPLSPRGQQLFITPGDDYYVSDRAVPEWEEDGAGWPVLTGATVTLVVNGGSLLIPATIVVATGSNKKVRIEMSRTVSAQIHEAPYELVATLADTGRKFTLAKGMVVLE